MSGFSVPSLKSLKLQMPDLRGDHDTGKSSSKSPHEGDNSPSAHHDERPRSRGVSGLFGGLGFRKDQDEETSLDECRYLQDQLESSKEEFEQQTSELMQELSKVYCERDALQQERDALAVQLVGAKPAASHTTLPSAAGTSALQCSSLATDCCVNNIAEIQRLTAERIALSRALAVSRGQPTPSSDRSAAGGGDTRNTDLSPAGLSACVDRVLESGLGQLRGECCQPGSANSRHSPEKWTSAKSSMTDGIVTAVAQLVGTAASGGTRAAATKRSLQSMLLPLPNDVELNAAVEERKMFKQRLHALKGEYTEAYSKARHDARKWQAKARGKQDTVVKLQEEKEDLYSLHRNASANVSRLQEECRDLSAELANMQGRLLTQSDGTANVVDSLREEVMDLQAQLSEANRSIGHAGVDSQSKDLCEKVNSLEADLSAMVEQHNDVLGKLANMAQTAERRKELSDQLAIEKQELAHKLSMEKRGNKVLIEKKDVEIATLNCQLAELEELKASAAAMDGLKKELSSFRQLHEELEKQLKADEEAHLVEVEGLQQQCTELSSQVAAAEENWHEAAAKVLICERKAAASLKDIRHQLTLESKRVARLQQELRNVVAEHEEAMAAAAAETCSTSSDGGESTSLVKVPVDIVRRVTNISSAKLEDMLSTIGGLSVDSAPFLRWKSAAAALTTSAATPTDSPDVGASRCPSPSPSAASPCRQPADDKYLYKTFSELEEIIRAQQLEKSALQERVNHLEQNAAGMADELVEKSAIIRSCVGNGDTKQEASLLSKLPSRANMTAAPVNLLRKLTNLVDGNSQDLDSPPESAGDAHSGVELMQRRVEEGIIKVTHLEQTVQELMTENDMLRSIIHS